MEGKDKDKDKVLMIESQGGDCEAADGRSGASNGQMGNPRAQVNKFLSTCSGGNELQLFHLHCTRVEIKDVCLAREMQRVMAAEAEATRDARAKVTRKAGNARLLKQKVQVIHSEGERKAAKALTEAALLLEQNPACLPLRYLQVGTCVEARDNYGGRCSLNLGEYDHP